MYYNHNECSVYTIVYSVVYNQLEHSNYSIDSR